MIWRLATCAVAMLGLAASAAAESVGGTVLPYGIMTCGGEPAALAERLTAINAESGITNFVLHGPGKHVRITGMLGREAYAENGRTLKAVADILRPKGMKVGYWLAPTMNCGIRHPYRKYVTESGAERTFTPCVGDRTFRADFAANCAAVAAEAHPSVFLMEDDFRYFGSGCFCADHLRRLGEKTGRTWTREETSVALKRADADGAKLRRIWHGLFVDDLTAIATAAREAVHAVSPDTRLGICMPGWFPEDDTATFARALAGSGHRPLVRCAGAFYGHSKSVELPGRMFVAQWSRENFPADFECILEADPCPHSRFYGSAARLGAMTSCAAAYGYDGALFIGLGGGFFSGPGAADDPLRTTPDFLRLHKREVTRWEAIAAEARKGASVGLQVVYSPRERLDAQADWKAQIPYPEFAPWARTLACMGLPYVTHEASVRLFATQWAFDDYDVAAITNLLAGRVVLDGAAAETLTARGFAPLMGVSAAPRGKVDFTGEMSVGPDGTARSFTCSYHTNYGLDGAPVSRLTAAGAEELAFFHAGDATKKVQPSVTYFENALGGRVAVLAPNLDFCESPNVFSFAKRDFLVGLFRRLGGDRAVPARVIDRANAQLIANADPEDKRLMLHVLNLSEDPIDSLELEVLPPYAGGTVEILDGDVWRPLTGRWDGVRLTLSVSAQVYKTVVLRIQGPMIGKRKD